MDSTCQEINVCGLYQCIRIAPCVSRVWENDSAFQDRCLLITRTWPLSELSAFSCEACAEGMQEEMVGMQRFAG